MYLDHLQLPSLTKYCQETIKNTRLVNFPEGGENFARAREVLTLSELRLCKWLIREQVAGQSVLICSNCRLYTCAGGALPTGCYTSTSCTAEPYGTPVAVQRFHDMAPTRRGRRRRLVINKHYVLVIMQTGLLLPILVYRLEFLPHNCSRSVGKCWCGWLRY